MARVPNSNAVYHPYKSLAVIMNEFGQVMGFWFLHKDTEVSCHAKVNI